MRWSACRSSCVRAVRAIPSYYLRYYYQTRQGRATSSATGTPGRRRSSTSRAQLLELYQDPTLAEKPALLATPRRRLLQRGRRPADRLAPRRRRRRPGRRHPQRRRAPRPAGRGRRRDPGPDRPRRGASPAPRAAGARACAAWSQAVKAYEELPIEAATTGDRRTALRALLANPLVGRLRHRGAAARRAARGQPGAPAAVLRVAVSPAPRSTCSTLTGSRRIGLALDRQPGHDGLGQLPRLRRQDRDPDPDLVRGERDVRRPDARQPAVAEQPHRGRPGQRRPEADDQQPVLARDRRDARRLGGEPQLGDLDQAQRPAAASARSGR